MIELDIPGRGRFVIKNLILDLNGTLVLDGKIIEGVAERLQMLSREVNIFIVTADTRGLAEKAVKELEGELTTGERAFSINLCKVEKGKENIQKMELVQNLGNNETISIGNGSNDSLMLMESTIGICVAGKEGASVDALISADIVTFDINDTLDLLLVPERIVATLRK